MCILWLVTILTGGIICCNHTLKIWRWTQAKTEWPWKDGPPPLLGPDCDAVSRDLLVMKVHTSHVFIILFNALWLMDLVKGMSLFIPSLDHCFGILLPCVCCCSQNIIISSGPTTFLFALKFQRFLDITSWIHSLVWREHQRVGFPSSCHSSRSPSLSSHQGVIEK